MLPGAPAANLAPRWMRGPSCAPSPRPDVPYPPAGARLGGPPPRLPHAFHDGGCCIFTWGLAGAPTPLRPFLLPYFFRTFAALQSSSRVLIGWVPRSVGQVRRSPASHPPPSQRTPCRHCCRCAAASPAAHLRFCRTQLLPPTRAPTHHSTVHLAVVPADWRCGGLLGRRLARRRRAAVARPARAGGRAVHPGDRLDHGLLPRGWAG